MTDLIGILRQSAQLIQFPTFLHPPEQVPQLSAG